MLRRFESVAGAYGAAALRKGDAQLTLDRIREPELTEGHRTQMATDNVAGEQQVKLTSGSRNQITLLHGGENVSTSTNANLIHTSLQRGDKECVARSEPFQWFPNLSR